MKMTRVGFEPTIPESALTPLYKQSQQGNPFSGPTSMQKSHKLHHHSLNEETDPSMFFNNCKYCIDFSYE